MIVKTIHKKINSLFLYLLNRPKLLSFFSLLIVLSYSCEIEKEINININNQNDKLNVHGFISNNGVIVEVRKTLSPLSIDNDDIIDSARVVLFEDNKQKCILNKKDTGVYISDNFFPTTDKEYHIVIESPGYQILTSEPQKIPIFIAIDSANIFFSDNNPYFNVVFQDTKEENNFYCNKYFSYYGGENLDSYSEIFNPYSVIEDSEFNGKKFAFINRIYSYYPEYSNKKIIVDSIQIQLYHLSPQLAKYLTSITEYEQAKEDPWYEQPFPVFSNIKNGYGIFGSYTISQITIITK
jgi:hypothetical protein